MLSKRINFSSVTWRCKGLEMRNATRNAMVGRSWNIFGKLDAAGFSFLFSRGYHPNDHFTICLYGKSWSTREFSGIPMVYTIFFRQSPGCFLDLSFRSPSQVTAPAVHGPGGKLWGHNASGFTTATRLTELSEWNLELRRIASGNLSHSLVGGLEHEIYFPQ